MGCAADAGSSTGGVACPPTGGDGPEPYPRHVVAQYKRFLERCTADPAFEEAFRGAPAPTLTAAGLTLDLELLRPVWDLDLRDRIARGGARHPMLDVQREYLGVLSDQTMLARLAPASITHPAYAAWRRRQDARTQGLFHKEHHDGVLHIPFAFELTTGCSGACPFCAFAPPPLRGVFAYTADDRRLWTGVLEAARDLFGPIAGTSVCYFATEPFDNPDYERFLEDFHAVMGCVPHTTTAHALKDPARTRRFLDEMRRLDRLSCRMSITSLEELERFHAAFAADEVVDVYLCMNNRESRGLYSDAGRTRKWKRALPASKVYAEGTSSCLTGFLVNMCDRTLTLTAPCNPDDARPFGYQVYGTASFGSAGDFRAAVERLVADHMPAAPPPDRPLRFRPELAFSPLDDGFVLSTRFQRREFRNDAYLRALGEAILRRQPTPRQIATEFEAYFLPDTYVLGAVQTMFDAGVLDDLPGVG